MSRRIRDLTGQPFGRLVVVSQAGRTTGSVRWLCRCACGGAAKVRSDNLINDRVRSCGCLRREKSTAQAVELAARREHRKALARSGVTRVA